jgi:hypothetical protein
LGSRTGGLVPWVRGWRGIPLTPFPLVGSMGFPMDLCPLWEIPYRSQGLT